MGQKVGGEWERRGEKLRKTLNQRGKIPCSSQIICHVLKYQSTSIWRLWALFGLCVWLTVEGRQGRNSSRKLELGPDVEAMEECYLLAIPHRLLSFFSYAILGHLTMNVSLLVILDLPHQSSFKKNTDLPLDQSDRGTALFIHPFLRCVKMINPSPYAYANKDIKHGRNVQMYKDRGKTSCVNKLEE